MKKLVMSAMALAFVASAFAISAGGSHPDLSGKWKLNEKESELRPSGGRVGMGGPGMGPSGGGKGGARGPGGPRGGHGGGERGGRGRAGLKNLAITRSGEGFVIMNDDGFERTLMPGETVKWEKSTLVVTHEMGEGRTATETWEVSKEGKLIVKRSGPRGTVRLVYDRVPEPAPKPQ